MTLDEHIVQLGKMFLTEHPEEAAALLEVEAPHGAGSLLGSCEPEAAAAVLSHMNGNHAAACLSAMELRAAENVLEELPTSRAAHLLRRLTPSERSSLLYATGQNERELISRLLSYPEGSVGASMDPNAFHLTEDLDVERAARQVRAQAEGILYYLYIVDRAQRLSGVLNLRDFVLAEPQQLLRDIMRSDVKKLRPEQSLEGIKSSLGEVSFPWMPVADAEGTFLGVVAIDRGAAGRRSSAVGENWEVLFALSELYWSGLSRMVGIGTNRRKAGDSRNEKEHSDGE